MLKPNGTLIIAEISKQGMERVNMIRKKYGLLPLNKRWHNLHIDEEKIFPKLKNISIYSGGVFKLWEMRKELLDKISNINEKPPKKGGFPN